MFTGQLIAKTEDGSSPVASATTQVISTFMGAFVIRSFLKNLFALAYVRRASLALKKAIMYGEGA